MKLKRSLTTALAVALMGVSLAACSGNNEKNSSSESPSATPSGSPSASSSASPSPSAQEKEKEFRFTLASDPPSLDPATMTDAQSSIVAKAIYDGLMRLDPSGKPIPRIAESFSVSDDGKTYTFKLRQDAKWSNGDPVTAHDFEYSWKRALAPETASDYAYMLFYLEKGEEYNAGKATADEVGVKALDDYTLEAKLKAPTPYFDQLVCHYTYWPVHKATVDGKPEWATEASTIVSNGPFLLKEWAHGDKLILAKNPDYFDKDKVHFTKATISLVEADSTVFNLFQTDKIDWIGAQAGSVPTDQVQKMVAEKKAEILPVASTYYYLFNTTKKPFSNVKIRKAFAMAVERQNLIDNVTKANQSPAHALVAPSITGVDGKMFREMFPDTDYLKEDVTEAKKLLAEGLAEEGLSKVPEITLLYNTNEGHKAIAEAIADMWRRNLGVEVKLANQEWGTFLETRKAQQFDVARSGWGADINHPINFTYDLIHSASGNNDGKYKNEKVDQLLNESLLTTDLKESLTKLGEAEKIAIKDDMGVLPLYYYTTVTMVKPGFKDVVSDYAGHLDWAFGDKE